MHNNVQSKVVNKIILIVMDNKYSISRISLEADGDLAWFKNLRLEAIES